MHTTLLIFGITGDLSRRKLLPALQKIVSNNAVSSLDIVGVSRREVDVKSLIQESTGSLDLERITSIVTMDIANKDDYETLRNRLAVGADHQVLVYLAVPPSASTRIVDFLGEVGLNANNVKILFEKPFGVDLASAEEMIQRTARYFNEDQLYRIDHYLAKDMAQNIVTFRAHNALFSHVWSGDAIEKIEVQALEAIDIEGRAQFYEQTGALRDLVQGHLMQLLSLVLMDIPEDLNWAKVPSYRAKALARLQVADPANVFRAQYGTYRSEVATPASATETFVAATLFSDDERWQNVPLHLVSGKALDKKTTEIKVHFRKSHKNQANCLTFRIQPHEGVDIELHTKRPGYDNQTETKHLSFRYAENTTVPDAYEQVLVDAIRSTKHLFTTGSEVIRSWQVWQPILDAWMMTDEDLHFYDKGSSVRAILDKE